MITKQPYYEKKILEHLLQKHIVFLKTVKQSQFLIKKIYLKSSKTNIQVQNFKFCKRISNKNLK